MLRHLVAEFKKVEYELGLFAAILNDPAFERRANVLLRGITRYVITTANHYLAGLRRQSAEDRFVRSVLWNIKTRLRLDWIEDLMVCLYRELGVMAEYRELHAIPVFYGPPHLLETIFELAGIYHEFGHSVSARHKDIGSELAIFIGRHFKEVKNRPGPLTPDQKETRDKTINQFAEAWTEAVRTEILCDIFGAYTCGTAYFALMVDLGISRGKDPYVQSSNSYPPTGVRVNASWNALLPDQRSCSTAQKIYDVWQRHSQKFSAAQSFRIGFAEELITGLTEKVVSLLQVHVPNTSRYQKCLPSVADAKSISAGITLEDLINAGVTILFEAPADFRNWQQTGRGLIT